MMPSSGEIDQIFFGDIYTQTEEERERESRQFELFDGGFSFHSVCLTFIFPTHNKSIVK